MGDWSLALDRRGKNPRAKQAGPPEHSHRQHMRLFVRMARTAGGSDCEHSDLFRVSLSLLLWQARCRASADASLHRADRPKKAACTEAPPTADRPNTLARGISLLSLRRNPLCGVRRICHNEVISHEGHSWLRTARIINSLAVFTIREICALWTRTKCPSWQRKFGVA